MTFGEACPFCDVSVDRRLTETDEAIALLDGFPVADGHCLIVPRRHVATWADATAAERIALTALIEPVCQLIQAYWPADGFNIGINSGEAAGQTVPHLHLHVIPRRAGDVADPGGGVRHVIPGKGNYPSPVLRGLRPASGPAVLYAADSRLPSRAVLATGADQPFLPLLEADLAQAAKVDIAVAFVQPSGVQRIYPHFEDLLQRGGRLRLLTGDYLGISDPDALERLLDLRALHGVDRCELRIYQSRGHSFHPKAYLLSRHGSAENPSAGVAWVGSSNLSASALTDGIEWNYRISSERDAEGWLRIEDAFAKLFRAPPAQPLDHAWLEGYRTLRPTLIAGTNGTGKGGPADAPIEPPALPPEPHPIQRRALDALATTRKSGYRAGLVVLATGLGKTWLSAFDAQAVGSKRLLFVAHRQEILAQAMATFRRVFPGAAIGVYTGEQRDRDANLLFASIQTLGKVAHLRQFDRRAFDYLVVDEFHHASAATYRRLIDYFEPRFLLGLTATPERSDGGDLMTLCQENLVYQCGVPEGIRAGLLSAYHYFGVPDLVDYVNIPWRSARFDEIALTEAVATQARAANILEQWRRHGGSRTLGFCVSQRHADFMRGYFTANGVRAAAVHAGSASDPRALTLERLAAGALDVVFAVDMFNEGIDVPTVDTVMMLRPTESQIVWLQQFGRGLRKVEGKTLVVIDYIGNHRGFLQKARALLGVTQPGDAALRTALQLAQEGRLDLPPGCAVTYELEAVDIMAALLRPEGAATDVLARYYLDFRERTGRRPSAAEAFHDGYDPACVHRSHGSWLEFVSTMGDLDRGQWEALSSAHAFLLGLEATRMTRADKTVLLQALLNLDAIPGPGATIEQLANAYARLAARSPVLAAEVGMGGEKRAPDLDLAKALEIHPIAAWVREGALGASPAFRYEAGRLTFVPLVPDAARPLFQVLTRELADWRLAKYLAQHARHPSGDRHRLPVSRAHGRPFLSLPAAPAARAELPRGWTVVGIDGRALEANFLESEIRVIQAVGGEENLLPSLLRFWFGPDAGQPGTTHACECRAVEGQWSLTPIASIRMNDGPEFMRRYSREQIPPLLGDSFSPATWNAGFVVITPDAPRHLILLVTLKKGQMAERHQYGDHFLSPDRFQWQSQNRTKQESKHGQLILNHVALGVDVHLFVRSDKRVGSGAAPFVYCGPVVFESWAGEKPITVQWKLQKAISDRMFGAFEDGEDEP